MKWGKGEKGRDGVSMGWECGEEKRRGRAQGAISQGTMMTGNSESEVAHLGNGERIRDRTK